MAEHWLLQLGTKSEYEARSIIELRTYSPNHDACDEKVGKQANGDPDLRLAVFSLWKRRECEVTHDYSNKDES